MLANVVKANTYYDSVTLMLTTQKLSQLAGVDNASVMMGTAQNKDILRQAGLLNADGEQAGAGDLIVCVRVQSGTSVDAVTGQIEAMLESGNGKSREKARARTLQGAFDKQPDSNWAFISVPGAYAAVEARKALELGLNVFLFSDNVTLQAEIELKQAAAEKQLLVMGPDCGTAYINGVAFGFANGVGRGDIGLVAASGTGLQEVVCLIAKSGCGISHAIGTGGRDLKQAVGGATMLKGISLLAEDDSTKVIVLISKPPAQAVEAKIIEMIGKLNKPVVVCLLGGAMRPGSANLHYAHTLEDAAAMAVALSKNSCIEKQLRREVFELREIVQGESKKLGGPPRFACGLFTGGTLCYESQIIFEHEQLNVFSNVPLKPELGLAKLGSEGGHVFIDMGDDEFTVGRPHPMIDPGLRNERLLAAAGDPQVGVILFDVVLGYGSHEDPAGMAAAAVVRARRTATGQGRYISFIASVCGTAMDPQNYELQVEKLLNAGVVVMKSNAEAARAAAQIIRAVNENRGCGK